MEVFLPPREQNCPKCSEALQFRRSRFGCIFGCEKCGLLVDAVRVLRLFKVRVTLQTRSILFLPLIDGPPSYSTIDLPLVVIELNAATKMLHVTFSNMPRQVFFDILGGLPLAVASHFDHDAVETSSARFPASLHDLLHDELVDSLANSGISPVPCVNGIPASVLLAVHGAGSASPLGGPAVEVSPEAWVTSKLQCVPPTLLRFLHFHQVEGVRAALEFKGRVLFADEMGVGKTLQAIASVAALDAFPVLIVCPAAMRGVWAEEVEKWLCYRVLVQEIHVVYSSNDALASGCTSKPPQVVIISYHMAVVLSLQLRQIEWRCVIADESQTLHTNGSTEDAQYTKLVCELGRRSQYCMFLSGTPSLVSPFDMFNQVDTLRPGLLGANRFEFALRYCKLQFSPFFRVGECTRPVELHSVLHKVCMVRRLKTETVVDLPSKQRIALRVSQADGWNGGMRCAAGKSTYQQRYSRSWRSKLPAILEVVTMLREKYDKLVVFAHHIALLDVVAANLSNARVNFIRINGSTPAITRPRLLEAFNSGPATVAIIGITACAVGVSLSAARCAVFCELPPDAAWAQQAEDRLHRLGQREQVSVFYIMGRCCHFDARHFADLCRAFEAVREVTDGVVQSFEMCAAVARPSSGVTSTGDIGLGPPRVTVPESMLGCLHRCDRFAFCISPHTGRIHVVDSRLEHAGSYPMEVAMNLTAAAALQSCVPGSACASESTLQDQLACYLHFIEQLSPFHYRNLVSSRKWLTVEALSTSKLRPSATFRSVNRYSTKAAGFGPHFVFRVHRAKGTSDYMGSLVRMSGKGGSVFAVRCLNCMRPHRILTQVFPGAVYEMRHDTAMFCLGECRERYFISRSSGAIRRALYHVDGGICTLCHINCDELVERVSMCRDSRQREDIVLTMHPLLATFPALMQRFVTNPVPGNCWHADHVVPVCEGGGEAYLDNLQTVCVACHALKTAQEAVRRHDSRKVRQPPGEQANAPMPASTSLCAALYRLITPCQRPRRVTCQP